jgi:hypothetical protein
VEAPKVVEVPKVVVGPRKRMAPRAAEVPRVAVAKRAAAEKNRSEQSLGFFPRKEGFSVPLFLRDDLEDLFFCTFA